MKYIRTKDGAILQKNGVLHNISKGFGVKDIKEADTIEELCDEFVIIDKTWEEPLYIVLDTKDDIESYLPSEIYGAIWTDKGLQFVACMNSKGELELL